MNIAKPMLRKRLLLGLATLPFLGVVAAFGIAPDTAIELPAQATVVEPVELPVTQAMDSGNFDFWREERIKRGDTVASLLDRLGVSSEDARSFLQSTHETDAL